MRMSDTRQARSAKPAARQPRPNASLRLTLQMGAGITALPASRAQLRRWMLAALSHDAELTLRFVGRREAQALNASYRGRDYAPDVLTFVYAPPEATERKHGSRSARESAGLIHADIVLCVPVLRAQAREARLPLAWRLAHLVIHGTLHAQGHDHEHDDEARAMQALETAALRRFRIPDPYAHD